MRKNILALFFTAMLMTVGFSAVDITATVGNEAPTVGEIQICDGTCAYTKTISPATQFTVQVTITDPNGADDIDTATASLEFYKTADSQGGTPDWDAIVIDPATTGTRDGCTQAGNVYCFQADTGDWTTKFLLGGADVYAYIEDDAGLNDSNESVSALTINATYGTTQDQIAVTFSGNADSSDNAQSPTSIETTHNGNTDTNVNVTATELADNGNTIAVGNLKWYASDVVGSAVPYTGGADDQQTDWARGTDPTSATINTYNWLDIPALQPAGDYTGTFTYASVEA